MRQSQSSTRKWDVEGQLLRLGPASAFEFGIEGGLGGTLWVLTGVSKKEEFLEKGAKVVPSAYVDALGDLLGE